MTFGYKVSILYAKELYKENENKMKAIRERLFLMDYSLPNICKQNPVGKPIKALSTPIVLPKVH